jgi:VIT1/CCC1 family predicted Fe2+/Mn2+ transporter
MGSALVVAAAYIAGALIPVLPVVIGATTALFSVLTAGVVVIVVSAILSFLSGMDIARRIFLNLAILTIAVSVTYAIGVFAKHLWGIAL